MTCRQLAPLVLGLAVLLGSVIPPRVSEAQNPADVAAARELFQEGARLSKEKRWEEAINRFVRSLALKPATLTLYTLAVAQRETGRLAESLENFRAFLSSAREPSTAPFERPAREAVAELEKRVAQLLIAVEPAGLTGLTVYVDGAAVPEAALGLRRLLNPGPHVVKAAAEGHADEAKEVTLSPGESLDVTLTLSPAKPLAGGSSHASANPAPADAGDRATAPDSSDGASLALPVTLLVGGAVTLGVGLAVGLTAVGAAEEAPTSDGADADAARSQAAAGDVVTGIGIGLAGAGLILLIVELVMADDPEPATGPAAWLRPSRRGRGLTLSF